MNCPKEIRQCPHGWTDCSLCANVIACNDGTYTPEPSHEEDIDVVIKAAEIATKVVNAEVVKSVESIRGTWSEKFQAMTEEERWKEQGKYPVPNIHSVADPYKAELGAFVPGGGGKMKTKKDTKGHKPTIYEWGTFK